MKIIRRSEWGALEPRHAWTPRKSTDMIIVHHTGRNVMRPGYRQVKDIQRFHMVKKKWNDIGYNWIIDDNGDLFEGRPEEMQAAHAGSVFNRSSVGIALLGDYRSKKLTQAAWATMFKTVIRIAERYGIKCDGLISHKDVRNTTCPGPAIHYVLPVIRFVMDQNGE